MIRRGKGFTLIELLISISILSLLLFTGTYFYRMIADRWETSLDKFDESSNLVKNVSILKGALSGIYPSIIYDYSRIDGKPRPAFFFIASNDRVLSITRKGVFTLTSPEIFRLITRKNKNGKIDLIYQTTDKKQVLIDINQEINFTKQIILLNDIEEVNFSYYGWQSVLQKSNAPETKLKAKWQQEFSGIDNQQIPEKMSVSFTKNGNASQFFINLDANSLRYLEAYIEQ